MTIFSICFHHLCRSYPLYFSLFFKAQNGHSKYPRTWAESAASIALRWREGSPYHSYLWGSIVDKRGMKRPCKTRGVKNNGLLFCWIDFWEKTCSPWRFFVWEVDFSFASNFTKNHRSHVDPGDDPGGGLPDASIHGSFRQQTEFWVMFHCLCWNHVWYIIWFEYVWWPGCVFTKYDVHRHLCQLTKRNEASRIYHKKTKKCGASKDTFPNKKNNNQHKH